MKAKLFVFSIVLAAIMFTGCPDTLVHAEPLDCTGATVCADVTSSMTWDDVIASVNGIRYDQGYGIDMSTVSFTVPVTSDGERVFEIAWLNGQFVYIRVNVTGSSVTYKDWIKPVIN